MSSNLQDNVKALSNHESFAGFIKVIHDFREECIEEMHDSHTDKLQQLSGRIISYDQILQMADFEKLKLVHKDFLNASLHQCYYINIAIAQA